jgi:hypothetical protein
MNEFLRPNVTQIELSRTMFDASLSANALKVAQSIRRNNKMRSMYELFSSTALDLRIATELAFMGRKIFLAQEGSRIGVEVTSNVLDSAREWEPTWDFREVRKSKMNALMKRNVCFTGIRFSGGIARHLTAIEERTGIDSFDVLLNHSVVLRKAIEDNVKDGQFMVALDQETSDATFVKDEQDTYLTEGKMVQVVSGIDDFTRLPLPDSF